MERTLASARSVGAVLSAVLDLTAIVSEAPFPDVVSACVRVLAKLFCDSENFARARIAAALRVCSLHLDAGAVSATASRELLGPIVFVVRPRHCPGCRAFFDTTPFPPSLTPTTPWRAD